MKRSPTLIIRVVFVLLVLGGAGYWFFYGRNQAAAEGNLAASGTIEVREVTISPELGGRITAIHVNEGDQVAAGQVLVEFDTTLLTGQLAQAQAGLAAAQANYDLLLAGASSAQLAAAEAGISRAQAALDALNEQIDQIESQAEDVAAQIETLTADIADNQAAIVAIQAAQQQGTATPEQLASLGQMQGGAAGLNGQLAWAQQLQTALTQQAQLLAAQKLTAEAGVDAAVAQRDLLASGARTEQLAAAQAQIAAAEAAVSVLQSQIERQTLTAPIAGLVLTRAADVGELAAPGAALLVLADLSELTMTVYVPEDQYGQINVGDSATIQADSFPGDIFQGTVRRIADQAEFTPRNVQTAEGRATTVYAVEILVTDEAGRLKPGMPVDATFAEGGQ
ncbi:MAG: efflux RND transporter periplasmic adaptor subunit [Anaerolineales bacterium]|nr:efflux RND transporter periplasmic adaptor subunit [Anaerolineales bacterium]